MDQGHDPIGWGDFCFLGLKDGRLHTGDHILRIGGTDVQGLSSEQVAQVLRTCGSMVRMLVARDPAGGIIVKPPTPTTSPVALPAVLTSRSPASVSKRYHQGHTTREAGVASKETWVRCRDNLSP